MTSYTTPLGPRSSAPSPKSINRSTLPLFLLVQALQKMWLMEKIRQDIENFGNNMAQMAHWISETGSAPIDFFTLVTTAFIYCKVLNFQLKATDLNDRVYSNPNKMSVDEIIGPSRLNYILSSYKDCAVILKPGRAQQG